MESLRGIAALGIVLYHASWSQHFANTILQQNLWLCVDFFFVLSGFVIAHNYQHRINGFRSFKAFMTLRLGRVYPTHLFFLLLWVGYELGKAFVAARGWFHPPEPPFHGRNNLFSFFTNLTLTHPYCGHGNSWNYPSWSISVEFGAYLVFGGLAWWFHRDERRLRLCAVLIALGSLSLLLVQGRGLHLIEQTAILRCCYGFCAGMLTRMLWNPGKADASPAKVAWRCHLGEIILVGGCAAFLAMERLQAPMVFVAIPLFSAGVWLFAREEGLFSKLLSLRPFRWLGCISYSIYMSHGLIAALVVNLLKVVCHAPYRYEGTSSMVEINPWLGDAILLGYVAAVLTLSHFCFVWIEKPWREKARKQAHWD